MYYETNNSVGTKYSLDIWNINQLLSSVLNCWSNKKTLEVKTKHVYGRPFAQDKSAGRASWGRAGDEVAPPAQPVAAKAAAGRVALSKRAQPQK